MRFFTILFFIIFQANFLFGQDGSNINYVKVEDLKESYVGRIIQIDFYNKSFGAVAEKGNGINVDKVLIGFDGKQIELIEHREDDGFNNWFRGQYLETADKKIKLKEFKLLEVGKDSIKVTGYFNVKPFTQDYVFKRKDLIEILVKTK